MGTIHALYVLITKHVPLCFFFFTHTQTNKQNQNLHHTTHFFCGQMTTPPESLVWFQNLKKFGKDEPQRSTNRKDNTRSIRIGNPTHTNCMSTTRSDKSNGNIFQKEKRRVEAFRVGSGTSTTTEKTYDTTYKH